MHAATLLLASVLGEQRSGVESHPALTNTISGALWQVDARPARGEFSFSKSALAQAVTDDKVQLDLSPASCWQLNPSSLLLPKYLALLLSKR